MEYGHHQQQLNPFECLLSAVNFVSSNEPSSPHGTHLHDFEVPQANSRNSSPASNHGGKSMESTSEDDDEDSSETEEFCVPRMKTKRAGKQPAGKRSSNAHNEVEKRRRAFLTQCYNELHREVPSIAGTKASNVVVLQSASEHIKDLEETERALVAAKADLMRHREEQLRYRDELLAHANLSYRGAALRPQFAVDAGEADEDVSASEASEYCSDEEYGVEVPDTDSRAASPSLSPRDDFSRFLHAPVNSKKPMAHKNPLLLLAACGMNLDVPKTAVRKQKSRSATKSSSAQVKVTAAPNRISRVSGRTIRSRPNALQAF
eukprot:m.393636 g.393636  ORF g.393636 m.393636 type:complete len:319 (-) comp21087_c1_seq33:214-1170(-)